MISHFTNENIPDLRSAILKMLRITHGKKKADVAAALQIQEYQYSDLEEHLFLSTFSDSQYTALEQFYGMQEAPVIYIFRNWERIAIYCRQVACLEQICDHQKMQIYQLKERLTSLLGEGWEDS